ncbi:MAG: methyltransferase domain-containing protein [Anaerolineae bacterium]|nr:methyltransferase domain-containing protein [Anaerolineae bacterium]
MSRSEPRGNELISRYKANYNIGATAQVTEEMILRHWNLEKQLRDELLSSTPDNRWDIFEDAYTRLYQELDWLNKLTDENEDSHSAQFSLWHSVIGEPPQRIYEIGSGKGELITYLAEHGFNCKATEITKERGEKWISTSGNLTWGSSDGIHLADFEPAAHYDIVLSNQVIEHMYPADVLTHFEHVFTLLKSGGRYILSTPHIADGPADVTRVFGHPEAMGMHLKEYTYGELKSLLGQAGFKSTAVLRLPKAIRRTLNLKPISSAFYLNYLILLEKLLLSISNHPLRVRTSKAAKGLLFTGHMLMTAQKP